MKTHYDILGITENANLEEIKSAYKQLAKQYHPDLNPSPHAEEEFKKISTAYQVISNTDSRARYDAELARIRLAQMRAFTSQSTRQDYSYTSRKRTVYKYRPQTTVYDKATERKASLYAIAMIAGIAAILFLGINLYNLYKEFQYNKLVSRFDNNVAKADSLFYAGKDKAALIYIQSMSAELAKERGLRNYESDYLRFRRKQAEIDYQNKSYKDAAWGLLFYMEYTQKQDEEMLYKLAICYRELTEFSKSVYILNELLNASYKRFHTLSLIASIYKNDLQDTAVALTYYEMGLSNIERTFKSTYGDAYRLLVTSENTPQIYKDIYYEAAKIYLDLSQFEKARKLLEWVVFFTPKSAEAYEHLYWAYNGLGRNQEACKVLKKAIKKELTITNSLLDNCNG